MPVGHPEPPLAPGTRFGRLTVTGHHPANVHGHQRVSVRCDCGASRVVLAGNLRHGKTRSCGCIRVAVARTAMNLIHHKRRRVANIHAEHPSP